MGAGGRKKASPNAARQVVVNPSVILPMTSEQFDEAAELLATLLEAVGVTLPAQTSADINESA